MSEVSRVLYFLRQDLKWQVHPALILLHAL